MKMTARDVAILAFINAFGWCEMPQVSRRFGLKKPRNYQVLSRLVEAGLLRHERIFHGRHGVYRLTRQGASYTDLPPVARVALGSYMHNVVLIDIYLGLRERYPECGWISERQLMREKHLAGVGQRGHLPDGVLVFPDGKEVAIEVELTLKSKYRLERILKGYGGAFRYAEVWYYCSGAIGAYIEKMTGKLDFVKVHGLEAFLTEMGGVSEAS